MPRLKREASRDYERPFVVARRVFLRLRAVPQRTHSAGGQSNSQSARIDAEIPVGGGGAGKSRFLKVSAPMRQSTTT